MKGKQMKISVLLCTYNGEKYIQEQLSSIINQSKMVDEIIVSDDCSRDHTIKKVEEFAQNCKINIKINSNSLNTGFKKNFYNGLSFCSGDIIFFSDQDDVWEYRKVEKIINLFESNNKALLVFSDAFVTNEKLEFKSHLLKDVRYNDNFMIDSKSQLNMLLADNFITGATMAIRKELISLASPFGMEWPHDYWLGIIAAINNGLYCINEPLIKYRQHASNAIGINKKYGFSQVRKLFSHKELSSNRENKYAELRLPQLSYLIDFLQQKNNDDYIGIARDYYEYWNRRIVFKEQGLIANCRIVLIDFLKKEQYKHRNTTHPVLKDLIKAIALAKRK